MGSRRRADIDRVYLNRAISELDKFQKSFGEREDANCRCPEVRFSKLSGLIGDVEIDIERA